MCFAKCEEKKNLVDLQANVKNKQKKRLFFQQHTYTHMQYNQKYGIPGYMVDVGPGTHFTSLGIDPAPSVLKQVVTRSENKTVIEYEAHHKIDDSKTLHLPSFKHDHCKRFLFYCHAPEHATDIHHENYNCFLQKTLPMLQKDNTFFICILHNVDGGFGYKWLSDNTIIIRRNNEGLDFGAFADGLHFTRLDDASIGNRSFFVFFMNDTVFGPTIPWWIKPKPRWSDVFESMLTDEVKLAGMTINVWFGKPHVQSMLMVTDDIGLTCGLKAQVFARRLDKGAVINVSEVGFSSAVLSNGFNIDCAAELLHGHDFRLKQCIPLKWNDITFDGRYDGFSVHPFETIFSKTNRMNRQLSHALMNHTPQVPQNTEFFTVCECVRYSQRCSKCKLSPQIDNTNIYFEVQSSKFEGASDYATFQLQEEDGSLIAINTKTNYNVVHIVCASSAIKKLLLKTQMELMKLNARCVVLFVQDMYHIIPFVRFQAVA